MKWVLFLLIFSKSLMAISQYQINILQTVIDNSKKQSDYKGDTFPKTMASICLKESSAGKKESRNKYTIADIDESGKIEHASLGILQIRVQTARYVFRKFNIHKYDKLSDHELAKLILNDHVLSIDIATKYFIVNINHYHSYFIAISRYNGGTKNITYVRGVMKNMKIINKLIHNGKLHL